jgi:deazaflavin-dependent oxidoreductase (nitroreductase family)
MPAQPEDIYVAENSPITDREQIAKLLKRDALMLRWFNYSPVARISAKANKLPPVSTFLLITKGRTSGRWHELPLYYFRDGKNYAVIGSNGGSPKPPKWLFNLQADPNCKFRVWWRPRPAKARLATPEERERIWKDASSKYPNYNDYAKSAGPREIPVMILEPQ